MNTCPCRLIKSSWAGGQSWWHGGGEAVGLRVIGHWQCAREQMSTAIQYRNIHTKASPDSSIHYCRLTRGWSMGQATDLRTALVSFYFGGSFRLFLTRYSARYIVTLNCPHALSQDNVNTNIYSHRSRWWWDSANISLAALGCMVARECGVLTTRLLLCSSLDQAFLWTLQ